MRAPYEIPLWKTAPLLRLLIPLVAGIIVQWHLQLTLLCILVCCISFFLAYILLYFLDAAAAFHVRRFQGFVLHLLIGSLGLWVSWQKDIRHSRNWYGHYLADSVILLAQINEPLIEKSKSYKAEAIVTAVIAGEASRITRGKILLYFAKDSINAVLRYGQVIILNKKPQAIRDAGNPAAFNYKQYAAFQQLHHQMFLKLSDWKPANKFEPNPFRLWLFQSKSWILGILRKYVPDTSHELGIAEALLIGYKEDLDQTLVQAYSNTGVVHIIAISGLHLGLIFFALTWICNRVPVLNKCGHIKVLLVLGCLWIFALLTGGSASVLRSAVMFTVIVIGKYYFTQSSVYSSLSASALLLLCYNPYYLWDVGFQLSYLAVIGIVAMQQPIYRLFYFRNRIARSLWNMASITIAAQLATFPICLYYFHQFPNYFLFTNMVTVPLSTVVLFTEVLLIIVSPLAVIAKVVGLVVGCMIMCMNAIILFFDGLPYGMIKQVYADIITTSLLYGALVCLCVCWLKRRKVLLHVGLCFLSAFAVVQAFGIWQAQHQQKIIIYNVPRCRAVDFIAGRRFLFVGDSALRNNSALGNFHLASSRIFHRANNTDALAGVMNRGFFWQFQGTKLIFLDSTAGLAPALSPQQIDLLLLSHNPVVQLAEMLQAVQPGIIVSDASNSPWQIQKWKKECEALNLRFHSVSEEGAFTLDVPISNIGRP